MLLVKTPVVLPDAPGEPHLPGPTSTKVEGLGPSARLLARTSRAQALAPGLARARRGLGNPGSEAAPMLLGCVFCKGLEIHPNQLLVQTTGEAKALFVEGRSRGWESYFGCHSGLNDKNPDPRGTMTTNNIINILSLFFLIYIFRICPFLSLHLGRHKRTMRV